MLAQRRVGGPVRRQQLDRYHAVEVYLACEVHDAHATTAQLTIDRITAGQRELKREEELIDGRLRCSHGSSLKRHSSIRYGGLARRTRPWQLLPITPPGGSSHAGICDRAVGHQSALDHWWSGFPPPGHGARAAG